MILSDPAGEFILHWGELGARWGVNRCVAEARAARPAQPVVASRIAAMQTFLEELHGWYTQIKKLPPASLHSLISIGSGITRLIPKSVRRRLD